MARLFDDAASDFLEEGTFNLTAEPFTLACWFNSDDATILQGLMWIGDNTSPTQYHVLGAQGNAAGDPVLARTVDGATVRNAPTSTGYTTGTWHHACGVWSATNSRAAYIDGGSKGTDTNASSVDPFNTLSVGRFGDSTPTNYMSGMIAEAAVWEAALTDAEVAILAKAVSPLMVRPESLYAYYPMIGRQTSFENSVMMPPSRLAITGTAAAAHPRIIYMPSRNFRFGSTAATTTGRFLTLLGAGR